MIYGKNNMKRYNVLFTVWMIIVVIIFALLCTLGFIYKNKVSKYKEYENTLVTATKEYLKENNSYPSDGKSVKVAIDKLIKSKKISKKKVIKECSGSIEVYHGKQMKYTPNIKCTYYKSKTN